MRSCFFGVLGAFSLLNAPAALAAGTRSLNLSATVTGTCQVTSAPGLLDFGTIDPSGTGNVSASTTFAVKCTKSTVSTAATDNNGLYFSGTKRMRHSVTTAAYLPYAISYGGDVGFTGQGFGAGASANTVTITGTVTPAQYQNALVTTGGEVYADTVTITVNP